MKIIDSENQLQNEALLNEYKGNLFEFLVANFLARKLNKESNFLLNLNQDFKSRLSMYEEFLRLNYSDLTFKLNELAKLTSIELVNYIEKKYHIDFDVYIIGKNVATNDNSLWGETDIVLSNRDQNLKFSLKLSKDHSYTNTKSAGIKSFLKKYFELFSDSENDQIKLNHEVDFQFNKMGESLYTSEGLDFKGIFDDQWKTNFPELPGELNPQHRSIVFENYSALNYKLYHILKKYFELDKNKFLECIFPLIGISQRDIIQVTTYHRDHVFEEVKIFSIEDNFLRNIHLMDYKEKSHSFDIMINQKILQIRIKPMNKFTTASYKINCSVKG